MRLGHLSDFHCENDRAVARTARAAALMLAQKPHVVLLTGDYVSGQQASDWSRRCVEALAPLTAVPGGVFAVLGNHDWWSRRPELVAAELERVGFGVLRKPVGPAAGHFGGLAGGLGRPMRGRAGPGTLRFQGVPEKAVKILLMHEPDYADEAPAGFALQLSGHSHAGGRFVFPGLRPLHCPKYGRRYPEGLQQTTQHPVYTTRGVGMMGPQVRAFCPPEVTVLTIQPK